MKLVTDTWRQLVQRRLWPVALLLLGALVAVPFVLGKSPEPAAPASAVPGGVTASAAGADPIVSMVSDEDAAAKHRALGDRHNPFASSAPKHKVKTSKAKRTSDPVTPPEPSAPGDAPANGGGGISAPTAPSAPPAPTKTVPAYSIVVRFGASADLELSRKTLERNEALPDETDPALVYLGVKDGGKTAVFMVSEGLNAVGDGTCNPKVSCETIELKVGETEFFEGESDTDSTQFELDLVKIYKHATKVPATDESSPSGVGTGSYSPPGGTAASLKSGRRAIRARVAKSGRLPYVYDRRSGLLRRP
jgi:hypothetical protein